MFSRLRPSQSSPTVKHSLQRRTGRSRDPTSGSWFRLSLIVFVLAILSVYTYFLATTVSYASKSSPPVAHHASPSATASKKVRIDSKDLVSVNDDQRVLALLYPPGLMGGYRNQVIRLLSLCVHAMRNKISQILTPSLMWATEVVLDESSNSTEEQWMPIPHHLLFDVDFWNAQDNGLPKLVDDDPFTEYDCWSRPSEIELDSLSQNRSLLTREVMKQGFLSPIAEFSRSVAVRDVVINPRKVDKLPDVKSCQNPVAYGGGKMAGRLWNNYINMQKGRGIPFEADAKLLKSLRPRKEWRDLSMSCVQKHTTSGTGSAYVALHARMELEMMVHSCGVSMEKNLTKLFGMMEEFIQNEVSDADGVFIAVNRGGMEVFEGGGYNRMKAFIDENIKTLNRVVVAGEGLLDRRVNVFECGRLLTRQYYNDNPDSIRYGGLLDSVLNFYVATEAKAFVGVRGSSYSTDIWTTRYHQGKGGTNFEYTPNGIKQIPNGGLPPPHTNCKRKK